ncbi:hypothetical protein H5410_041195 [Solanum commersonii]|uniref:Uncharacterized protein n=1 Tax=Solanum commersonii TaxID=4109 RepID=A0A9J5XR48_SOLCO|nr:hypothetical protein H5410_041195 [Solanum commersonii]
MRSVTSIDTAGESQEAETDKMLTTIELQDMDPPWIHIKGRGRGRSAPGRGPSYGAMTNSPLYAHMQAYLEGENQKDTFASITKEDTDDIKSYEKLQKKEMIFFLENSDL